jgi:class 3 adenylate cyclase
MQSTEIPSEYIKPHYSTKLIKSIYNYFLKYYSEEMIEKIFSDLKMEKSYFLNDDNWHSNDLNKALCEKIINETGDKEILFNIGKELLQPQNINFMEYQILKILPPYLLLKNLPAQAAKINNVYKMEILSSSPGYVQYLIKIPKHFDIHPGVFKNTEGCLHAINEFCGLENFSLKKTQNETDTSRDIVYTIKYTAIKYWVSKIIPTFIYISLTYFITVKILSNQIKNIQTLTAFSFIFSMLFGLTTFILFKKVLSLVKNTDLYYVNTKEKNERIYEKTLLLENKLKEEQYIKNICITLIRSKKVEDIIDDSLDSICKNPRYEKAMVMLASERNKNLKTVSIRGLNNIPNLEKLELSYPATDNDSLLFSNILDKKKSVLIDDISTYKEKLKIENRALIESLNVNSLIVSPIGDTEKSYGLLVIGSTNESSKLNTEDLKFIEHICSLMSLFFQKSYTLETESTLRSIFEKYVPKNVLNEMNNLKDQNSWRIPPQSKHVASMFIDLKGFTNVSENLTPENVFKMLDLYFESIARIVGARGGIIDNIIGDEMVVFFPESANKKHCTDCLLTAIEICADWNTIQKRVSDNNLPILSVGIGMHSGMASIGTVGSDIRSNYTCLGDTINTASRIQKLTRKYFPNTDSAVILTSRDLFENSSVPIKATLIEKEKMRGKINEIDLYAIQQNDTVTFSRFLNSIRTAA